MPDPNRQTADRAGASLATDASVDGALVYAVGDIHGRYDLFKMLLARITADYAERARGRRPVLILCGDYVDRGPDSAKVLQAVLWLQRHSALDLHLLKGNHEQAMRAFIDEPESGGDWLAYGGAETLLSYGVPPLPPQPDSDALRRSRDDLVDRMPASHLQLIEALELCAIVGDYAFVHAGIRPGVALKQQTERDLLWIRAGFLDAPGPFEKVVVHGHSWRDDQPQLTGHRIGIDTGAYATGVLSAVRLEDGALEVLQARGAASKS